MIFLFLEYFYGSASEESVNTLTAKFNAASSDAKTSRINLQTMKKQFEVFLLCGFDWISFTHFLMFPLQHEARKNAKEYEKVQHRLQKLVTDRASSSQQLITLINPLPSVSSSASKKLKGPYALKPDAEQVMYDIVIRNYEDREKQVMAENNSLRQTLFSLFEELKPRLEQLPEVRVCSSISIYFWFMFQ